MTTPRLTADAAVVVSVGFVRRIAALAGKEKP